MEMYLTYCQFLANARAGGHAYIAFSQKSIDDYIVQVEMIRELVLAR